MSAKVTLEGLTELRDALRRLPAELAREADAIVISHATAAKNEIQRGYPIGPTGNLAGGITVEQNSSKFTASALVRSRARHAAIFEHGSRARRTIRGVNRGRMPAASPSQAFIPRAIRWRQRMTRQLVALVRRAGFEVSE